MWFTNVIKPTHRCNLGCSYCFNEDTRNPVMPDDVLESTIIQTFDYAFTLGGNKPVDFIWHGGEPMAVGINFYDKVVNLQKQHSKGLPYTNCIQTNGTLLNDNWIKFIKESGFEISLSIDGPQAINDSVRKYLGGKGSYEHVMRGINLLREANIQFGVCVVISQVNKDHTDEIYDFLAKEKLPFNIIPLTRSGSALNNFLDLGISAEEYAEPWIKLFDKWFDSKQSNYIQCTDFVRKSRAILIGKPTDCIGQEQCAVGHISTDPDGYVYPCATLSGDKDWVYGNLATETLNSIMSKPIVHKAQNRQVDPHCKECKWNHICHGGCMSRSIKFYGTHNTRDYYCPSLYQIYDHIESKLQGIDNLDKSKMPKSDFVDVREIPSERPLTNRRKDFQRVSINQL